MTKAETSCRDLSIEEKEGQIKRKLTEIEFRLADPDSYEHYIKFQTYFDGSIVESLMDIFFADRVDKLRKKGKIRPIQKIEEQAEWMADMTPCQMDWAFAWTTAIRFLDIKTISLRRRGLQYYQT